MIFDSHSAIGADIDQIDRLYDFDILLCGLQKIGFTKEDIKKIPMKTGIG